MSPHQKVILLTEMQTRYSLQQQAAGTSACRLSPTATWTSGPLRYPGLKKKTESMATDTTPRTEPTASADNTTMSTEIDVDATEHKAGVKDDPTPGIKTEYHSDESSVLDGDDHLYVSTLEPEGLVEHLDIETALLPQEGQGEKVLNASMIIDEQLHQDIESVRKSMTQNEQTQVDKRMEKVSFLPKQERPQEKRKGIDPRNWGGIDLDESEIDTQIQREILAKHNARCKHKPQPNPNNLDATPTTAVINNDASKGRHIDKGMAEKMDIDPQKVTCEDVLDYLRNKRKLVHEMDKICKKEKSAHRKCRERAGSEPISDELTALIQRVAEGSKNKHRYKSRLANQNRRSNKDAATKPIIQIMVESALGRAFDCLDKRQRRNNPDLSDTSSSSESESDMSLSYDTDESESSSTDSSAMQSSSHHRERS